MVQRSMQLYANNPVGDDCGIKGRNARQLGELNEALRVSREPPGTNWTGWADN